MKLLIAGASGYVGQRLSKRLDYLEYPYVVLNRCEKGFSVQEKASPIQSKFKPFHFISLEQSVSKISDMGITHLINLAGNTNKGLTWDSTRNLIRANLNLASDLALLCLESGISNYTFTSTYSTHSDKDDYSPQTYYAATKKAAEDILFYFSTLGNINISILNLYDVYGPEHPHGKIINYIFDSLRMNRAIRISSGEQEICPIYIDDVIAALLETVKHVGTMPWRHFDIAGPEIIKVREIPKIISRVLDITWEANQIQRDLPARPNEIQHVKLRFGEPPFWKANIDLETGIRLMNSRAL